MDFISVCVCVLSGGGGGGVGGGRGGGQGRGGERDSYIICFIVDEYKLSRTTKCMQYVNARCPSAPAK